MPAHSSRRKDGHLQGDRTTGPDELEAGPVIHTGGLPGWVVPLVGALLVLLALGGGGYAAYRYNANKPTEVITIGPSRTPWALMPPLSMGEYSRDANSADTPSMNPNTKKSTITATYSKGGQATVVLLMSRPETDAKKFMTDMGMNAIIAEGSGFCGTSSDNNHDGCAVIRDNTAISVVDLVGLSRVELMDLANQFGDQLAA